MSRYDGPIIDAHQHFWEPHLGRQPWLRPEARIDFRYGSYERIKRTYLPPDLLRDASGFNLVGTVFMETEWEVDDSLGEMRYVEGIANRYGMPNAAVAHAVLRDSHVVGLLEQLSEMPLVRSVRNKPGQAASPQEAQASPTLMMDADWRKGFAALARFGLHFDLQVAWWHLPEAGDLAQSYPDQVIVINHAALPADRSEAMMRAWEDNVRLVARLPNVRMKVSGIGLPGLAWTVSRNRRVVETLVDAFGSERIMFASNFPVDSLCGTYPEIMGGFIEISQGWSASEQFDAFAGTAIRTYGLDPAIADS